MSGQIKMSPGELDSQASGYRQGADEMRETLGRLKTLQENLRGQWEGKAFVEFDNQFVQLGEKSEEFSQLLERIEKQLKETARAMQEQDVALSKNFGLS